MGRVALAVLVGSVLVAFAGRGATRATDDGASDRGIDELLGLWGAERVFPPAGPLPITIAQSEEGLFARVLNHQAVVRVAGERMSFELPADQGSFRGRRVDDRIEGHWISKRNVNFYGFATPVTLHRKASGTWEGTVETIENRFSLYIPIERNEAGETTAFLRNPERNQGVFTRFQYADRDGNEVHFLNGDGQVVLTGQYHPDEDQISVYMPWRGGTYDFTRMDRSQAAGFFPRPDADAYRYSVPVDRQDGWRVGSPESVGLDSERLEELVQSVLDTRAESLRSPYIQSVLVARRGQLVLEEYFYGFHHNRPHDLRSAAKSITGTLMGIALEELPGLSVDTPVYSLFEGPFQNPDPRKDQLTIEHLLTMRTGLDCDDNDYDSPGNEDRMQSQDDEPDWYRYTLDVPMARQPGTDGVYCTGGINLMGGIVSQETDTWLPEFFHTRLAKPLGIEHYHMNLDPLERGYAGGGIYIRPRDFLKFGQMVLDGGQWNGERVVSADWIARSVQPHASVNEPNDYGYTWWTTDLEFEERTVQSYSATGNGGQLLVLVPEFDLVVGFNGGNYSDFRTWIQWRDRLVPEFVLDAVSDR